jgi:hypothetical protein
MIRFVVFGIAQSKIVIKNTNLYGIGFIIAVNVKGGVDVISAFDPSDVESTGVPIVIRFVTVNQ